MTETTASSPARRFLVVLGGHPPVLTSLADHHPIVTIVCADSGLDHALALGLRPDVVIGDFDSATPDALAHGASMNIEVISAPTDKDRTDTELALALAQERGATEIDVLWGGGDRFDHVLGVVAAMAGPGLATIGHLRLHVGRDLLHIVHGPRRFATDFAKGTIVSLIPIAGSARGVTTTGLRWNLSDETLWAHGARGVSNIAIGAVTVAVDSGVLAVVVPWEQAS
ncbi:MAG: thiamine diphosphokinase [Acidimicrobiia bacterium]